MKNLIFVLILVISSIQVKSQSISIFDIDTTNFPTMKAKFYAFDKDGKPTTPNISDLQLTENGINRTITSVSCPVPKVSTLSVGIMVDTYSKIDLARKGVQKLIDYLYLPQDEIGITYMAKGVYIYQDFTKNKQKASASAALIPSAPGVDINAMFYSQYTGGIPFIKDRQSDKKILILVSDLHCPNLNINEAQLIADAKANNISIYSVLLGSNDYTGLFSRIAKGTDGVVFERVLDENQITNIFQEIERKVHYDLCEIKWNSDNTCNQAKISVTLKWNNISSNLSYTSPYKSISKLIVNPKDLNFGEIEPFQKSIKLLTLKAENNSFLIKNIKLNNGTNYFKFEDIVFPYYLEKDSIKIIKVIFEPLDSSLIYANYEIETDFCNNYFTTYGGFSEQISKYNNLKLNNPNGGEEFIAGSNAKISWEGINPNDNVNIELSIDKGKNWKLISDSANNLIYNWKNVPLPKSNQCLIKITHYPKYFNFGNNYRLYNSFVPSYYGLNYNNDGTKIIARSNDATAIWDIVSKTNLKVFYNSGMISSNNFSNNDNIIIYDYDSTFAIYNTINFQKETFIKTQYEFIRTCIHPYNNFAALSISKSNYISIWDLGSKKEIAVLKGHNGSIYCLDYNINGTLLASGSADKSVIVWQNNNTNNFKILKGHTGVITSIKFSKDSKKLLTSDAFGNVIIWDVSSGNILINIKADSNYIYGACFNNKGNQFITGGEEGNIKIWDTQSGNLIKILGNQGTITGLAYNPVKKQFASSNIYGIITIWEDTYDAFQQDVSDSLFSIIAPEPKINVFNIDMGKVVIGNNKDTSVTNVICNIGEAEWHILGVDITKGQINDFMVPRGAGEFFLQPNECQDIMFDFMPLIVGKRNATITVRSTIGNFIDTIKITGEGVAPEVKIANNLIDFGKVQISDYKDSLQVATLINTSKTKIRVSNISFLKPNDYDFISLDPINQMDILPGDTLKLNLKFTPSELGRTSGRLQFDHSGVGSPAIVSLFGEGIDKYPQIKVNQNSNTKFKLNCGRTESIDTLSITNLGNDTLDILSIGFTGVNKTEFQIENPSFNFILPKESKLLPISYKPNTFGNHSAIIEIKSNSKLDSNLKIVISGSNESNEFILSNAEVNIGDVLINESKDTTLYIENTGSLINTYYVSLANNYFSTDKSLLRILSKSKDSLKISFIAPNKGGNISDKIIITDSICSIAKEIQLLVNIIGVPKLQLFIGNYEAKAGDSIDIALNIISSLPINTTISFELEMNKTILFPIGVNSTIDGDYRIIKFDSVPINNVGLNEVAKLKFIATLGNAEETAIRVRNIIPIGNDADFDVVDGNFKLLGVCKEGGDRYLSSSLSQTKLMSIAPNPATESIEIEYSNADEGEAEIIISNLLGQTILTQKLEKTQTGKTKLDLSQLPTGQYSILFKTETVIENRVLQVIK